MPDMLATMKNLRQLREFKQQPVNQGTLDKILEIARWTGSAHNGQPWHLVVVRDRSTLKALGELRNPWMAEAVCAIGIATPITRPIGAEYDEGRLSERIMLAAEALGLGSGTAWYVSDEQIKQAREILRLPEDWTLRSFVVLGHIERQGGSGFVGSGGRKPINEIVSYEEFGNRKP